MTKTEQWDIYWLRYIRRTPDVLWIQRERPPMPYPFLTYAHLIRGKTVLDYGCGCGMLARDIAHHAGKYYGVDISPFAVALAKTLCPNHATFLVLNEDPLPTVDTIIARHVFYHLNEREAAETIAAMNKTLRPGGTIWCNWCQDSLEGPSVAEKTCEDRKIDASVLYSREDVLKLFDGWDVEIRDRPGQWICLATKQA